MNKKINVIKHISWCCLAFVLLMGLNWIALRSWLCDNVMPYDYEFIDEYTWSFNCCLFNTALSFFSILLICRSVLKASSYRKPIIAWRNWLIAFSICSLIVPIMLIIFYPLDGQFSIYLIEWLYCILTTAGAFFVITYLAPYQLSFNPCKH